MLSKYGLNSDTADACYRSIRHILLAIPSFVFECGMLLALFATTYIHTYIHTYNIILYVYWNFSVIYINYSSVNLYSIDNDDDSNNNVL